MTDQSNQNNDSVRQANSRTVKRLFVVAVIMFGFGYALVPLYDLICDVTGLNGKTGRTTLEQVAARQQVDAAATDTATDSREVVVEFMSHTSTGLPWEFRPMSKKMTVKIGQPAVAMFYARNTSGDTITGQAIPSVSPNKAGPHFKKTECFCFSQQTLKPGEEKEMPVQFVINSKLDPEVKVVTLSYSFFNAEKDSAKKYGGEPGEAPANHNSHEHHAHSQQQHEAGQDHKL
ncbi:MAG: cytochrome c oxidase assembly protein [Gammaproteobacteria bacterium]|nr:cytochrome c oxidase assembly protein [Gammaproteobacteria bacterium]